jgi:hypothetical protein
LCRQREKNEHVKLARNIRGHEGLAGNFPEEIIGVRDYCTS